LGQLIIVAIIVGIAYLVLNIFNARQRDWVLFISGAAAGTALILILESDFVASIFATEMPIPSRFE